MSTTPKAERLRDARIRAGFDSAAEAAQRFGWTEPAYRHHENGTRSYGPDAARKYGRAFRVKPAWLLGIDTVRELPDESTASDRLLVAGSVAAGVWRETEIWDEQQRFEISLPSPVPGAQRFGVEVEGRSMDEIYEPGTILDCISIFKGGVDPKSGDHVIVERIRSDGLREHTVKEYREEGGRYLLVPRSSRTEFKPLEYSGPDRDGATVDGEAVQVIAFVVAAYPPRVLELFRRMGLIAPPRTK